MASRSVRELLTFGISLEKIRDHVRSGREDGDRPSRFAGKENVRINVRTQRGVRVHLVPQHPLLQNDG